MKSKQLIQRFIKMTSTFQKKIKRMRDKDKFLEVLVKSNGHHNAIDLGAQIGLDENTTMEIIMQLLAEYKIEYAVNGVCDYSLMRSQNRVKRSDKQKNFIY
ncbi:hypothetical protein [Flavobacterium sp.]|uniref:hypothetical protein n=1 Tax=Flavobacterium sp. TaxID=239 RepID=UPI003D148B77